MFWMDCVIASLVWCSYWMCARGKNDPPSRPLSPTRQLAIMRDIETELAQQQLDPTNADLEVTFTYLFT